MGVGLGSFYGLGFGVWIDYGFVLDFLFGLVGSGILELILVINFFDIIKNLFDSVFSLVEKEIESGLSSIVEDGLIVKY